MGWGPNSLGINFGDGGPAGPTHRRGAAGVLLSEGQWVHFAAVVRGPDSTDFSLYVNGSAIAHTYDGSGGPMAHDPLGSPNIGGYRLVAANEPWLGSMDDLRLYNCALDAAAVTALQTITTVGPRPAAQRRSLPSPRSGLTEP